MQALRILILVAGCCGPIVAVGHFAVDEGTGRASQVFYGTLLLGLCIAMWPYLSRAWEIGRRVFVLVVLASYLGISHVINAATGAYVVRVEDISTDVTVLGFRIVLLFLGLCGAFVVSQYGLFGERELRRIALFNIITVATIQIVDVAVVGTNVFVHVEHAATYLGAGSGISNNVSLLAAALCSSMPLLFLKRRWNGVDWIWILVLVGAVVFTWRRSLWMSVVAGVVVYAILGGRGARQEQGKGTFVAIFGFSLAALTIVWLFPVGEVIAERLRDLSFEEGSGSGRYVFWDVIVNHIVNHITPWNFVLGEGVGATQVLLWTRFGDAIGAHNDWLDLYVQFGATAIGLLLMFVVWLVSLCRAAYQVHQRLCMCLSMAVAMWLVMSVSTGGLLEPSALPFYVFVGFAAGVIYGRGKAWAPRVLPDTCERPPYDTGSVPSRRDRTRQNLSVKRCS